MSIECNMESYMIFTAASKFCRPVAQTELLITERSFFFRCGRCNIANFIGLTITLVRWENLGLINFDPIMQQVYKCDCMQFRLILC